MEVEASHPKKCQRLQHHDQETPQEGPVGKDAGPMAVKKRETSSHNRCRTSHSRRTERVLDMQCNKSKFKNTHTLQWCPVLPGMKSCSQ